MQGVGITNPRSAADMADVLIMDKEGGVLHYQTSVDQAAAAACMGRAPVAPLGGGELHVYEPHASRGNSRQSLNSSGSGNQQQQQQGLAPGEGWLYVGTYTIGLPVVSVRARSRPLLWS